MADSNSSLQAGASLVSVSPTYYRPTEVDFLIGNPTKVEKLLGWKARTKFEELAKVMVEADLVKVLERGY